MECSPNDSVLLLAQAASQENGGQQKAMVIRKVCPQCQSSQYKKAVQHKAISKLARKTKHIERFNNTLRQRVSRLVRAALSFSKKLANPIGAIKLFICHDNLTRATA
jgi:hypothetical protein